LNRRRVARAGRRKRRFEGKTANQKKEDLEWGKEKHARQGVEELAAADYEENSANSRGKRKAGGLGRRREKETIALDRRKI